VLRHAHPERIETVSRNPLPGITMVGSPRMAEPPLTRVTLLARIRDGRDADAWREFVQLYGPVVYRFARNRGLQDADAADLMQDVLRSVVRNAPRMRSEEHTSELQSRFDLVCRLLLEKKKK